MLVQVNTHQKFPLVVSHVQEQFFSEYFTTSQNSKVSSLATKTFASLQETKNQACFCLHEWKKEILPLLQDWERPVIIRLESQLRNEVCQAQDERAIHVSIQTAYSEESVNLHLADERASNKLKELQCLFRNLR
jgi:hypothetical protein